ncbi:unnamed protein product [Allacma fusca]|uniref:Uncharacterized protein n=1 Tax=Allacma fusca TaxID=39272 RepID=A0A8J2LI86_9HEXA|nr:unnamed protein product [Allacma fusca]
MVIHLPDQSISLRQINSASLGPKPYRRRNKTEGKHHLPINVIKMLQGYLIYTTQDLVDMSLDDYKVFGGGSRQMILKCAISLLKSSGGTEDYDC